MDYLFDTESFPKRSSCVTCGGEWEPWMVWTWIGANMLTCASYLAIATVLMIVWRRHRHLPGASILTGFAAFIAACGVGHLVCDVLVFFWPAYRWFAIQHAITAALSLPTAILCWTFSDRLSKAVSDMLSLKRVTYRLAETLGESVRERKGDE